MERKYFAYQSIKEFYFKRAVYKDVKIQMFREGYDYEKERKQYDFHKLIKDYRVGEESVYPERVILELFTKGEIEEIKASLEKTGDPLIEFFHEEIQFPIDFNSVALSHKMIGGPTELYHFQGHPDYPMKVKVGGYVDISECEEIKQKPKQVSLEPYHQFYAFDSEFDDCMILDEDNHALTASNTGELLDDFRVLLLIRKGTSKETSLTLLAKITEWMQGFVLQALDKHENLMVEHSPSDNILWSRTKGSILCGTPENIQEKEEEQISGNKTLH